MEEGVMEEEEVMDLLTTVTPPLQTRRTSQTAIMLANAGS